MTDKVCKVCGISAWKYKCPQCLIHYCSVGCYKNHKANTCPARQESVITAISHKQELVTRPKPDDLSNVIHQSEENSKNSLESETPNGTHRLQSPDNEKTDTEDGKEEGEIPDSEDEVKLIYQSDESEDKVDIKKLQRLGPHLWNNVDPYLKLIPGLSTFKSELKTCLFKKAYQYSKAIREMLENPHLRKVIEDVYNAKDPAMILANTMQEPIFTEFTDECLKVVYDKMEVT